MKNLHRLFFNITLMCATMAGALTVASCEEPEARQETTESYKILFEAESEGGAIEVSVDGVTIEDGDPIEVGKTVAIEAVPEEGYVFSKWTGSVVGMIANDAAIETSFEMPGESVIIEGSFVETPTYSVTRYGSMVNGTVTYSVDGVPQEFGTMFPEGTRIDIRATPDNGYSFKEWAIQGGAVVVGTTQEAYLNMPAKNVILAAIFEPGELD